MGKICFWVRRTTCSQLIVTGARHDSLWFPHLQREREPSKHQNFLIHQGRLPKSLSFFSLRTRHECTLFCHRSRQLTSLPQSQNNQPMKAGGLDLFFFKAWMKWCLRADSWEAGRSGSWVLYYTSKVQPAPPNFVSLAPSSLVGRHHT